MRRLSFAATVIGLIVIATTATAPAVLAGTADHPLVGSWTADTNVDDPSNPLSSVVFNSDGTYLQVDVQGVAVGSWAATGAQTANLTAIVREQDQAGQAVTITIRAAFEVAEDGNSFTASYTLEFATPDGSTGQQGPGTATGTRIAVEAPGEPVGPITGPETPSGASPDASASPGA
jgi:hypothetical protein